MALFDRLLAEKDTPAVIDVSYRAFKNFFTIVQEIHFFQEARHRFIEPPTRLPAMLDSLRTLLGWRFGPTSAFVRI
jgi:hypothetical protein